MNDLDCLPGGESVAPLPGALAWTPMSPTQALLRRFDFADEADITPVAGDAEPGAASPTFASQPVQGSQQRQGFRIGPIGLMVDYAQGSELTELPRVHRLPHAPAWFAGICNLHGALVPVFDLALRMGVERDAKARPMLLVLGHGADAAGMVVDGIPTRLRFSPDAVADAATVPEMLDGLVTRAALIGERLWFDLDVPELLAGLERALGPPQ